MPDPYLRDEIMSDPAGLGYAGKTDQQIVDLMNAATQLYSDADFQCQRDLWRMSAQGIWGALLDFIDSSRAAAAPDARRIALGFRDTVLHKDAIEDQPALNGVVDALVAAGCWTRPQGDAVLAMRRWYRSRASLLGYGYVTVPQIADTLADGG